MYQAMPVKILWKNPQEISSLVKIERERKREKERGREKGGGA